MATPALRAFQACQIMAACALLVAGCTEPLSVDNRVCPCTAGYTCCPSNNLCLPEGTACEMARVTALRSTVRQGDVVSFTVVGFGLADAANVELGEIKLGTPSGAVDRGFQMAATIPHGTPLGAKTLRFTTQGGRKVYTVEGVVTVSPITVSMTGDDKNWGTSDSPFRTFSQAMNWVGGGDTIHLTAGAYGDSSDPYLRYYLPNQATLEGDANAATLLSGELVLNGDASIRNLAIDSKVEINGVGSKVTISGVSAQGHDIGFRVTGFASAATLVIGGKTRLASSGNAPVTWEADGGILRVIENSVLSNSDDANGEAIHSIGSNLHLEVTDASISSRGANNIALLGGQADVQIKRSFFQGLVDMMSSNCTATVTNATFQMASEVRSLGGIYFVGDHLEVSDSTFTVVALVQDNYASKVIVRRTIFTAYTEPAVLLSKGTLDLGTMDDPGGNQFKRGESVASSFPVAVKVVADTGMASATMSATTIDGTMPPMLGEVMGPAKATPYYQIDQMDPIWFY